MSKTIILFIFFMTNLMVAVLARKKMNKGQNNTPSEALNVMTRHSFEGPFLMGLNAEVRNWEYGASAVATENFIRLVPATKSRTGWMWNTEPLNVPNWEVTFKFNIHNTMSPGADGLAFWYAKDIKRVGSMFGNQEEFKGFGIIFDSYDNDGDGDAPAIYVIQNDGKKVKWNYGNDLKNSRIESCKANFRNPAKGYAVAKITYQHGMLNVGIDTIGSNEFKHCLSASVHVPTGYHLGLTAATGGLADYHDVLSLITRDLNPNASREKKKAPHADDHKGWWDPYEEYVHSQHEKDASDLYKKRDDRPVQEIFDENKTKKDKTKKTKTKSSKKKKPKKKKPKKKKEEYFDDFEDFEDDEEEFPPIKKEKETKKTTNNQEEDLGFESIKSKISSDVFDDAGISEMLKKSGRKTSLQLQDMVKLFKREFKMSQNTAYMILEALEKVSLHVQNHDVEHRDSIQNLVERIEKTERHQEIIQRNLKSISDGMRTQFDSVFAQQRQNSELLENEVRKLNGIVQQLQSELGTRHGKLHDLMTDSAQRLEAKASASSSKLFTYFLALILFLSVGAYVYYRMMTRAVNRSMKVL